MAALRRRRVIIATVESVFCSVTYPDRTGDNTMGTSVFDAAVMG
jgi:hypothetical protein